MDLKWAKRIADLPPYLFAEIDAKKSEMRAKGMDIIDLASATLTYLRLSTLSMH